MSKKTLAQSIEKLGYSRSWDAVAKINTPEKYKWMMSFDKDKGESIIKASKHLERLQIEVENIYYNFENDREFNNFLIKKGVIEKDTSDSMKASFIKMLFRSKDKPLGKTMKTIIRYEKVKAAAIQDGIVE